MEKISIHLSTPASLNRLPNPPPDDLRSTNPGTGLTPQQPRSLAEQHQVRLGHEAHELKAATVRRLQSLTSELR